MHQFKRLPWIKALILTQTGIMLRGRGLGGIGGLTTTAFIMAAITTAITTAVTTAVIMVVIVAAAFMVPSVMVAVAAEDIKDVKACFQNAERGGPRPQQWIYDQRFPAIYRGLEIWTVNVNYSSLS